MLRQVKRLEGKSRETLWPGLQVSGGRLALPVLHGPEGPGQWTKGSISRNAVCIQARNAVMSNQRHARSIQAPCHSSVSMGRKPVNSWCFCRSLWTVSATCYAAGFHPACNRRTCTTRERMASCKDFQRMMQPLRDTPVQGLPFVSSLSWGGVPQHFSFTCFWSEASQDEVLHLDNMPAKGAWPETRK